jgi:hypothetical protein
MRPKTPLGRGAGKSAGRGIGGGGPGSSGGLLTQERTTGGFVRNLDGTLKRPLERVGGGEKSGGEKSGGGKSGGGGDGGGGGGGGE